MNAGCVLFKEGDYDGACKKFMEALTHLGNQVCVSQLVTHLCVLYMSVTAA